MISLPTCLGNSTGESSEAIQDGVRKLRKNGGGLKTGEKEVTEGGESVNGTAGADLGAGGGGWLDQGCHLSYFFRISGFLVSPV